VHITRWRLIQPPRLRSEDGLEEGRRVTWMELFFDLIFVAAVAQVGTHLRDDYSPAGLLRFALLFLLIWWAWLGHTSFSTRFDTDDLVQRALTALQDHRADEYSGGATATRSPWQNAYVERVIESFRRECVDHVIVMKAAGLHQLLTEYVAYYMRSWTRTPAQ